MPFVLGHTGTDGAGRDSALQMSSPNDDCHRPGKAGVDHRKEKEEVSEK